MTTKPHLVFRSGVWCVQGPTFVEEGYWTLHELAVAWAVKRWKEQR